MDPINFYLGDESRVALAAILLMILNRKMNLSLKIPMTKR